MSIIIITGANSGIGYETAKELALNGNHIIAACRKPESINVINELNLLCTERKAGSAIFYQLDLADLSSVSKFISDIKQSYNVIDTLICNAGVMNPPYSLTIDGFELQFQSNYLSHFKLTLELIELMKKSTNPKVIYVGSASSEKGIINSTPEIDKTARIPEGSYHGMTSYRESKLLQQVSLFHFSRIEEYQAIKFAILHPGIVNTNLFYKNSGKFFRIAMYPFVYLGYLFRFFKTPKQGARTSIWLAQNEFPTGKYWHLEKPIEHNPIADDLEYGKQVFEWTKKSLNQ
ncbi:MAG: SDR family NAD(P)-dependent oxidoreductase [Candidatus Heimdallarchaeota archaeon]|nr:SDR family NAD(P)-dependent oxidoreductase [Candidatus Heimdallarchaeota archaeon]